MSSIGSQAGWLVVLASACILAAVGWVYHRLSGMAQTLRAELREQVDRQFSQIEGLLAMYARQGGLVAYPATRNWAASPDILHAAILHVQQKEPRLVIECSSGVSTLVLANQMRVQGHGRVISLENSAEYADKTRAQLRAHGLQDWAEVVHAPLKRQSFGDWNGEWYDLSVLPIGLKADLLVIDGPPSTTAPLARYPALPALKSLLSEGAAIMLDDAARPDEQLIVLRWLSENAGLVQVRAMSCEKGMAMLIMPSSAATS